MNNIVKKFDKFNENRIVENNEHPKLNIIVKGAEQLFTEDSYEKGEIGNSRSINILENLAIRTTEFNNFDELFTVLHEELNLSSDPSNYSIDDINEYIVISTDRLVKEDSSGSISVPTEEEKEQWKKGNMKLYNEHTRIIIEVRPYVEPLDAGQIQNIIGNINLG